MPVRLVDSRLGWWRKVIKKMSNISSERGPKRKHIQDHDDLSGHNRDSNGSNGNLNVRRSSLNEDGKDWKRSRGVHWKWDRRECSLQVVILLPMVTGPSRDKFLRNLLRLVQQLVVLEVTNGLDIRAGFA
jgi:hypothetical protein